MGNNLRPLWDALLDLYEKFAEYCKKHNIRYYATGGTCLGAVRHNGFIPWDDDLDFRVPRPDYVRLVKCFSSDPIPNCDLISMATTPDRPLLFAKLRNLDPVKIERVERLSGLKLCEDGIYIDLIPMDGYPKSTLPFYWWYLKYLTWHHRGSKKFLIRLAVELLWRDRSQQAFERWLSSYDYETSACVEDVNAPYGCQRLRMLSAASYGEPIMHKFDRVTIPLPREWEKLMFVLFGPDYMTPPPDEVWKPQHSLKEGTGLE